MKIGEIIKKYRESHHLSMGDFSAKTGLSKAYIAMLEKDVNPTTGKPAIPTIKTLEACAKAMTMPLGDLIIALEPVQGNMGEKGENASVQKLTPQEKALLVAYRQLERDRQVTVDEFVQFILARQQALGKKPCL